MRWGTDLSLDKSTVGEEGTGSELVFLPVNTLTPGVRICAGEKIPGTSYSRDHRFRRDGICGSARCITRFVGTTGKVLGNLTKRVALQG